MKLADPIDKDLEEEMKFLDAHPKPASTTKRPKKRGKDVSNASSSNTMDITNSSITSVATDTVLNEVLDMEDQRVTRSKRMKMGKSAGKSANEEASDVKKPDVKGKDCIITHDRPAKFKTSDFDSPAWIKQRSTLILPKKDRPLPSPQCSYIVEIHDHNYGLWTSMTTDLESVAGNWEAMSSTCQMYSKSMNLTNRIESVFGVRLNWDNRDWLAHSLWPRDGPYDRSDAFEINTEALGDCLLAACSRLVYGTQNHTRELRTRMTVEGIEYKDWYLDSENLRLDLPYLNSDTDIVEKYVLFSGTKKTGEDCYKSEVMRCFSSGAHCALWQIHHLSSVIARPIITVFPEFDDTEEQPLRYYHNRTIMPRPVESRAADPVTIMWTMASPFGGSFTNHFVAAVR